MAPESAQFSGHQGCQNMSRCFRSCIQHMLMIFLVQYAWRIRITSVSESRRGIGLQYLPKSGGRVDFLKEIATLENDKYECKHIKCALHKFVQMLMENIGCFQKACGLYPKSSVYGASKFTTSFNNFFWNNPTSFAKLQLFCKVVFRNFFQLVLSLKGVKKKFSETSFNLFYH